MTRWWISYTVWGAWLLLFFVLEIPGAWNWVPWVTLSETVEHLEVVSLFVKIVCFAVLIMLVAHWVLGASFVRASLFGLLVAVAAHLVDHRWP